MLAWLSANLPTLLTGSAVLALAALSLRNLLQRKGKCAGCPGCCAGCTRRT